jgi:hypothetical protein
MMPQESLVSPPRLAAWLIDLFTPNEQTESILGDLLEEFSGLASKSGPASASRGYWRQSAKTIVHLVGLGFRVAPWSIVGAVLVAYLLLVFGASLPEEVIVRLIHFRRHHVTPYYNQTQLATYVLWFSTSILIGRLLMSLIIGCLVALAAKGREMAATMMLGLFSGASVGVFLLVGVLKRPQNPYLLPFLFDQFAHSIAIVVGGIVIRESRSSMSRRTSGRLKRI